MNRKSFLLQLLALLGGAASSAHAQDNGYPKRPVKIVVPFGAGANPDVIARLFADRLQRAFGQAFVIENKPGAGGTIGADAVSSKPADGYTLFYAVRATMGITPHMFPKVRFNPVRDFSAVSQVVTLPHVLTANLNAPFSNLAELVDAARKSPGKIDYGSLGVGSHSHIAMEYWARQLGIKLNHVPYNGNASADVMAGVVSLFLEGSGSAIPLVNAGKVKALAVTGGSRVDALAKVQTISEYRSGLDDAGVVGNTWHGIFAPKGTPEAVVSQLNREIVKIAQDTEVRRRLAELGAVTTGTSADYLNTAIANDYAFFGKMVHDLRILAE